MLVIHARIVPAVILCTDQIKVFPFPDGNEQMCSKFSHRLFKFLTVDLFSIVIVSLCVLLLVVFLCPLTQTRPAGPFFVWTEAAGFCYLFM